MNHADFSAHAALAASRPVRYSPPPPRDPYWLPGQGWLIAVLGSWNAGWIGFVIYQFITRTLA